MAARRWPVLVGLLALAAYWPLWFPGAGDRTLALADARTAEQFFFEPHQSAPLLIVLVAGWRAWRRRHRFLALPARSQPVASACCLAVAVGAAVWAQRNAASDLLIFSLIALGLALALATRGRAGCRALALPLGVLLFALPIPGRLQNELIWHLQLASATGAEALLSGLGAGVEREGLLLTRGDAGFLVIESCSGFRSMHILLFVSIVLRDLFELRRFGWLLIALSAPIAMALNVARIVWIVLGAEGEASAEEHVGQGLTVLLVGTALLFAVAWLLERLGGGPVLRAPAARPDPPNPIADAAWRRAALVLAVIALVPVFVDPWPLPRREPVDLESMLADRPGWEGEDVVSDRIFIGSVSIGRMEHRQLTYAGSRRALPGVIEAFVGIESRSHPRWSPFSDLLLLPARDWGLRETQVVRDWRLFRSVQEAVVTRGPDAALIRMWRIGDRGPIEETLRSLLALERGPFERSTPRAVVRIGAPIELAIPKSIEIARERLDQFVIDYASAFERLEAAGSD